VREVVVCRDGELWEGHCLKLLSLCHRYVMLTETPGRVGKLLDFFSLLLYLLLFLGGVQKLLDLFPPPSIAIRLALLCLRKKVRP